MMKKRLKISKKIYVPPLLEFEEIEQDELDMLMAGSDNSGDGDDFGDGGGDVTPTYPGLPVVTPPSGGNSVDMDFSMDFVINE